MTTHEIAAEFRPGDPLTLRAVEALERIANATEQSSPKTLADQFKALPRADRDRFIDQIRGFLEEG